jgi:hypothetical protein
LFLFFNKKMIIFVILIKRENIASYYCHNFDRFFYFIFLLIFDIYGSARVP